ncbi:hypothetical protein [Neorhizobium galegae]|uniref:hypothetical protein n=1 Tax=Neorhizobium galegae TaxID=399 RepID=UPI000621EB15|nr:hypothetical protein [Neorhizobium galegae]CDZ51648.1 Hypothetical protein NGAL_HAMBI2427_42540 [Neorhizobium galegae bv. orientalis]
MMEINSGMPHPKVSSTQSSRSRQVGSPEEAANRIPRYSPEEMQSLSERLMKGTPVEDVIILDKSQYTFRDATPEEMAAFTAGQAAYAKSKADQAAWEKEISNIESNEVYFSNVAVMDLDAARNEANVVKIFVENGMLDGRHVNAFNGDQKTSSPQEYLSWIYQRIEALEAQTPKAQ